ncbi:MAG: hypothetical protein MZV49_26345 [Rhodopseudomonas palustris]|nr:hypothetical protein [Rhodopseudomonas palustris]
MVEQTSTPTPNVVDFVDYQLQRKTTRAMALKPQICRHCGATLGAGQIRGTLLDRPDQLQSGLDLIPGRIDDDMATAPSLNWRAAAYPLPRAAQR